IYVLSLPDALPILLIDDGLATVGEVTELCLPQGQRVGVGHGVAVLEAQARVLGERGVVGLEAAAIAGVLSQRLQWAVAVEVLVVEEDSVALGEGAAQGVLADETDELALGEDYMGRAHG